MDSIRKKYLCKTCGDNNMENFYEGRYSSCKICRNKSKTEANRIRRLQMKEPKILKGAVNGFWVNDYTLFEGVSPYQTIKELRDRLDKVESENSILKDLFLDVEREKDKIKKARIGEEIDDKLNESI
jgi:hypothetical protein